MAELKYITLTPENVDFYGIDANFYRMPDEIAAQVSPGVRGLSKQPAGGRVRFATNSTTLALRAEVTNAYSIGFDLYSVDTETQTERFITGFHNANVINIGTFEPVPVRLNGKMTTYTVNFPYNANIAKVEIGIDENAVLEHGDRYRNEKPVLFYGSSITTGGWASRPGCAYIPMISQRYNLNYLNFGFSGNGRGEPFMAQYLASFDMSGFVLDYDHNSPNAEHLKLTHLPFYQTIRAAHPDIPILLLSKPDYWTAPVENQKRLDVIRETYEYAKARGENVYMIEGKTFYEGDYSTNCSKDGCHPNDLGFYRMAEKIGPVVAEMLGIPSPDYDVF